MPKEYVRKGDPYESQCVRTTELLRAQLGSTTSKLMLTFQSRFGRAKWLEPYTINTVKALAKKGVKNLVVITPGFSADCLETLEEIAVENAHVFKRYGGENFAAIPCLNDSEAGMLMIWQLRDARTQGLGVSAIRDGSLVSWVWFLLALVLFVIEAIRPGRFALWLGFAAVLVGIIASVARWPWPAEARSLGGVRSAVVPAWRRYERKA